MAHYRLAVDTGGTFSDFVILDEDSGRYRIVKMPSTPQAPAAAVLAGLDHLRAEGVEPRDIAFFSHGTTVATNALIQERGARTGLVVTEGFRGIYETMEQSRPYGPAVFDLGYAKPALLARPRATAEVRERIGPRGEVRLPLDESSLDQVVAQFEAERVASVAVCLLFSFMNPVHEQRVKQLLVAVHPEWWVSTSSELLPQIREYYRLSTTVINAYVSPVVGTYTSDLAAELDRRELAPSARFTMQSNGGSSPFDRTAARAVGTILSGPAGGVSAGRALAAAAGVENVITFDMGGTSCDVALIQGGEPVISDRSVIGGRVVAVPMYEINTVSAGGGTLATVDAHGALHVGPHSAGAVPGPVSYGRGGRTPTVTDANLVLGYLNPKALLGGAMQLDVAAATEALERQIAAPLGVDVVRAAAGIVEIVNVTMSEAIKAISTERGFDIRDFTLLPFGGAGPLHACQIALELGVPRLLIPPAPGATSALGLLMADIKHDYLRSRLSDIAATDPRDVTELFSDLSNAAVEQLTEEGFDRAAITLRYFLDMRYEGQGYENPVLVDRMPVDQADLARYRSRFDDIHLLCYGHAAPGQAVEIVTYRVEGIGVVSRVDLAQLAAASGPAADAQVGTRAAHFPSLGQVADVPVYDRAQLRAGHTFDGPALVDQYDSTTVICPGQAVTVDRIGNLLVEALT